MKQTMCWLAVAGLIWGAGTAGAGEAVRFEAEDITEPRDAWLENRHTDTHWNLWSTDKDAMRKWSGGIVLQSPRVLRDRKSPEDGAPPLHSVVRGLAPGKYHLEIGNVGRSMGVSMDGGTWQRIDSSDRYRGVVEVGRDGFELWVDDRYVQADNPGSCYYDYLEFTPLPDPKRKPLVEGIAKDRIAEKLDRGVVAMPAGDGAVYVGWRLLLSDPSDVAFDVYRHPKSGAPVKLNAAPLTKTTDFVDRDGPDGRERYSVVPVAGETVGQASKAVLAGAPNHLAIKMEDGGSFQKCGIADLDGDGAYDYVLKTPNANIDPYVKYWKRSPDTYKIEAYLADGTFLWRHDLGWSIERGIWYSPMLVYDLDGDGKAEVCLKAGEGDPRDPDGRVQSGPEYLVVLDGMTGQERCRIDWPDRAEMPGYNYASRNQMCVAYLDGRTPCLVVVRGTYNVIIARAYEFRDGDLRPLWSWKAAEEGGGRYRGQGAHSMHAVDVDSDGRDEVFLGSAVLDDNGVGLWSAGLGHPDHHYVGDIDPERPGLEVYYGIESRRNGNGCCLVDARTGEIIWGLDGKTRHVHSTGLCADIDPASPGVECYSSDTDSEKKSERRWLFDARGKVLRDDLDWSFGLGTVYWDADPQRELIRGSEILNYEGGGYGKVLEGKVIGFADVLGDWREELIVSADGELRVYTTTIPATDRRVCLMQDPLYRLDVCVQAMGYTQCPMMTRFPGAK